MKEISDHPGQMPPHQVAAYAAARDRLADARAAEATPQPDPAVVLTDAEREALIEALMSSVMIPGPVRASKTEFLVLTHGEASTATPVLAAAVERIVAAHTADAAAEVPGTVRLWNVVMPDGSLYFSRGVREKYARRLANGLTDWNVVTRLSIPAHQTDWTPA